MVNGLGVLAWGVGGIEAEAALLGQPIYMAMPRVVGVRLSASCRGLDRDRPRPRGDPDAPGVRRRRARSSSSPATGSPACRSPTGDDRQHEPRVRGDVDAASRSTTRPIAYLRLTGRTEERNPARRDIREGAGPVAAARPHTPTSTTC
jgi:hypothetical protein